MNLTVSARTGSAAWAAAPLTVHIINGRADHAYGPLRSLGAAIARTPAVQERSPLNKVAMFRAADPSRQLIALDCDLLLSADLDGFPQHDGLSAVPAEFPLLASGVWRDLYSALKLPLLADPLAATVSGQPIPVPYFNSGVVVLPGRWGAELAEAWLHYAGLARQHEAIPRWTKSHDFHLEQIALACALSYLRWPLDVLPVEYNAPFRIRNLSRVKILHYHAQINRDGTVREPPSPAGAAIVQRFNTTIRRFGLTGADWPGS